MTAIEATSGAEDMSKAVVRALGPSVETQAPTSVGAARPAAARESEAANDVYLEVRSGAGPVALFRFSQRVKETVGAELAYFSSSPGGAVMKLAMRKRVSILEVLSRLEEVERVHEEPQTSEATPVTRVPLLHAGAGRTVYVSLKG